MTYHVIFRIIDFIILMYLNMNIFFIKKNKENMLFYLTVKQFPCLLSLVKKHRNYSTAALNFQSAINLICSIFCIINYQYTDSLDTWNCIVPLNSNDIYFVKQNDNKLAIAFTGIFLKIRYVHAMYLWIISNNLIISCDKHYLNKILTKTL